MNAPKYRVAGCGRRQASAPSNPRRLVALAVCLTMVVGFAEQAGAEVKAKPHGVGSTISIAPIPGASDVYSVTLEAVYQEPSSVGVELRVDDSGANRLEETPSLDAQLVGPSGHIYNPTSAGVGGCRTFPSTLVLLPGTASTGCLSFGLTRIALGTEAFWTPDGGLDLNQPSYRWIVNTYEPDAQAIVEALGRTLPVRSTITYNAKDDPDSLLGRQSSSLGSPGYISKTAFADARVPKAFLALNDAGKDAPGGLDFGGTEFGGEVEVFQSDAQAVTRAKYILSFGPLDEEHSSKSKAACQCVSVYEHDLVSAGVLVRLSGGLSKQEADSYIQPLRDITRAGVEVMAHK